MSRLGYGVFGGAGLGRWARAFAVGSFVLTSSVSCAGTTPPVQLATGEQTFTGVRLNKGNAVDCPALRISGGRTISVSHLPSTVPIGGTVTVRGVFGYVTKCNGRVLIVRG